MYRLPILNLQSEYTANRAKYATTPAAMKGFEYLKEGYDKGWYQDGLPLQSMTRALKCL